MRAISALQEGGGERERERERESSKERDKEGERDDCREEDKDRWRKDKSTTQSIALRETEAVYRHKGARPPALLFCTHTHTETALQGMELTQAGAWPFSGRSSRLLRGRAQSVSAVLGYAGWT